MAKANYKFTHSADYSCGETTYASYLYLVPANKWPKGKGSVVTRVAKLEGDCVETRVPTLHIDEDKDGNVLGIEILR